jgi:Sad1 / UNC-like C-terminal
LILDRLGRKKFLLKMKTCSTLLVLLILVLYNGGASLQEQPPDTDEKLDQDVDKDTLIFSDNDDILELPSSDFQDDRIVQLERDEEEENDTIEEDGEKEEEEEEEDVQSGQAYFESEFEPLNAFSEKLLSQINSDDNNSDNENNDTTVLVHAASALHGVDKPSGVDHYDETDSQRGKNGFTSSSSSSSPASSSSSPLSSSLSAASIDSHDNDAFDDAARNDDDVAVDMVDAIVDVVDVERASSEHGNKDDVAAIVAVAAAVAEDGRLVLEPCVEDEMIESKVRNRANYASAECGAKVIKANSEASDVANILNGARDKYMLNLCSTQKWLILELCDELGVDTIQLANYEYFSSMPRTIQVSTSVHFPQTLDDFDGSFVWELRADNVRELQTFVLPTRSWARYILLRVTDHYNDKRFCPLSEINVYGYSHVDELKLDLELDEIEVGAFNELAVQHTAQRNSDQQVAAAAAAAAAAEAEAMAAAVVAVGVPKALDSVPECRRCADPFARMTCVGAQCASNASTQRDEAVQFMEDMRALDALAIGSEAPAAAAAVDVAELDPIAASTSVASSSAPSPPPPPPLPQATTVPVALSTPALAAASNASDADASLVYAADVHDSLAASESDGTAVPPSESAPLDVVPVPTPSTSVSPPMPRADPPQSILKKMAAKIKSLQMNHSVVTSYLEEFRQTNLKALSKISQDIGRVDREQHAVGESVRQVARALLGLEKLHNASDADRQRASRTDASVDALRLQVADMSARIDALHDTMRHNEQHQHQRLVICMLIAVLFSAFFTVTLVSANSDEAPRANSTRSYGAARHQPMLSDDDSIVLSKGAESMQLTDDHEQQQDAVVEAHLSAAPRHRRALSPLAGPSARHLTTSNAIGRSRSIDTLNAHVIKSSRRRRRRKRHTRTPNRPLVELSQTTAHHQQQQEQEQKRFALN